MRVTFKSGRQAYVTVQYDPPKRKKGEPPYPPEVLERARTTTISVKPLPNESDLVFGQSVCSPKDNYCRRTGRQLAVQRLMEAMKNAGWSKEDRALVWAKVCPPEAAKKALDIVHKTESLIYDELNARWTYELEEG